MRAAIVALSLFALLAVAPSRARAQETTVRFPVAQAGDTTFSFRAGQQQWVRPGLRGIVVDPRQQDVLVARFRIYNVSQGTAQAVITGQTTTVGTQHMVLLDIPRRPWYKERMLWVGAGAGALLGFLLGSM